MKLQSFLFLLVIPIILISIVTFSSDSFAQSSSVKSQIISNEIFIFVQTIVENSNGELITYLTSNKFSDIKMQTLTTLLDVEANEKDPIITIDGKKFQVIKRQLTLTYDKKNVIASTLLGYAPEGTIAIAARFAHDGYPIVEGDTVRTIWTFLRPVG